MGAWSHEPFGNDDAADWVYELEESSDFSVIESALTAITARTEDYLEAPECSVALAAAEIVAALIGRPIATLPQSVAAWIEGMQRPDTSLVNQAQQATRAILESSELQELWEESDDYSDWQDITKDLLMRLG